jgi:hypothetical protein
MTTREQFHQLADQVDDDTAEEVLEFARWLLREQAAQAARTAPYWTGNAPRPAYAS